MRDMSRLPFHALVFVAISVLSVSATANSSGANTRITPSSHETGTLGNDPHYCDGCTPPLTYSGGPVLNTAAPAGLTITPIYWEPSGSSDRFPTNYESIIDGYVKNIAAASGTDGNVYSVAIQYYQTAKGAHTSLSYDFKGGTPQSDSDRFPANGCSPASGYNACITDAQLQSELKHFMAARRLPTGLDQFYPLFFPPKVETRDRDGSNSVSDFCGYHRGFGSGSSEIIYADMPFVSDGCGIGQEPNGSYAADGAVSTLSHELNEAMTDPTDSVAWDDSTGHEIGDICADAYGPPLGSTSSSHPDTTEYNQVINGGKYYTQEEFSDRAYSGLGFGSGCQQRRANLGAAEVVSIFSDASPFELAADGKATTGDRVVVTDKQGYGVSGDQVTFSEYNVNGSGSCGKLSDISAKTDADGVVNVNYTTSKDSAVCMIVATEASGGLSSQSIIYQGSAQSEAPTADANFPSSLQVGASPVSFKLTTTNPANKPITSSRVDLVVFPYDSSSPNVVASQVHITYSTTGSDGTFAPMTLTGSTVDHGGIDGYVPPLKGETLAAHQSKTVYLKVSLVSGTPVASGKPTFSLEGFLDQINSATGSGTTLADTFGTDVTVSGR